MRIYAIIGTMSYDVTAANLGVLSRELEKRYEAGEPLDFTVSGRPKLHILSFDPLAYEQYGALLNRAPNVAGNVALRAFLTAPHPAGRGALVYAGVQVGEQAYGFEMNGYNESHRATINDVAVLLGHPEIQLTPPRS